MKGDPADARALRPIVYGDQNRAHLVQLPARGPLTTQDPPGSGLRAHARCALSELALDGPVIAWRPGQAPPRFGPVAHRLRTRWDRVVSPETVVVVAERSRLSSSAVPRRRRYELMS